MGGGRPGSEQRPNCHCLGSVLGPPVPSHIREPQQDFLELRDPVALQILSGPPPTSVLADLGSLSTSISPYLSVFPCGTCCPHQPSLGVWGNFPSPELNPQILISPAGPASSSLCPSHDLGVTGERSYSHPSQHPATMARHPCALWLSGPPARGRAIPDSNSEG